MASKFGMMGAGQSDQATALIGEIAPHAPTLMMMPLIGISVALVLLAVILLAAMKNKMPGALLLVAGGALGGGSMWLAEKSERRAAELAGAKGAGQK